MNNEAYALARQAFSLLKVKGFIALSRAYTKKDQVLMKNGKWDATDHALITNQIREILENIIPGQLKEKDREWHAEILWFWYHHAISYAVFKVKDRMLAEYFSDKALEWQSFDHPNRITRLLWFLVRDDVEKANQWITDAPPDYDVVERETALFLLERYKECDGLF